MKTYAERIQEHLAHGELKKIVPLMRHILSNETDPDILAATLKTAGELAMDTLVDDIAEFILYNDADLKALAVKALEKTASGKALDRLRKAAATSKRDRNILDAIQRIQAKSSFASPLEKTAFSDDVDDRIRKLRSRVIKERFQAVLQFAKNNGSALPVLQKSLASGIPNLMVTALHIVSRTLPETLADDVLALANDKTLPAPVRFAAYEALEAFPCLESADLVLKGLEDPSPQVRMAAARVLDKNPGDHIRATVKDRIESGTRQGAQLAETLLDAHTRNLTDYLMISDTFFYMASNHLSTRASFSALENYIAILHGRNLKSTAGKYQDILLEKNGAGRHRILAVSSSGIRLAVYDKLIYQSGFRPVLFDTCQKAFESIMEKRPLAVISDLFLHDITGVDFTREIREIYPPNTLPVILCTMQQDFVNPDQAIAPFPPEPARIKDLEHQRPAPR
ncbi:MAG: hypothetical protein K9J83_06015 [Desulfarculaceae bacterium]|nr:hypothetical protein [Desulfarculaceae bacterium]